MPKMHILFTHACPYFHFYKILFSDTIQSAREQSRPAFSSRNIKKGEYKNGF